MIRKQRAPGSVKIGIGFRVYLDPEIPYLFKDLYKEIIKRNPKKVGYSGLR